MIAVIFDTETTGLLLPSTAPLEKQPRIIEIGAVKVDLDTEEVFDEVSQLINPECELDPKITKITGIKPEDLADKPTFVQVLPVLQRLFRGAEFLVCHNAPFDVGMLKNELRRAEVWDFPWPGHTVCTVAEYTHMFGRRPKLTELYERVLGEPLAQTHRALDDVKALHAVLTKDGYFRHDSATGQD